MFASVLIVTRKNHCSLPVERSILIWHTLSANVLLIFIVAYMKLCNYEYCYKLTNVFYLLVTGGCWLWKDHCCFPGMYGGC